MHRFSYRLHHLEAQADKEECPDGQGLAALLAWARVSRTIRVICPMAGI
jgi:hypothetical protein